MDDNSRVSSAGDRKKQYQRSNRRTSALPSGVSSVMNFGRLKLHQVMHHLLESPLGYFVDNSEDLEPVARSFTSHSFSAGETLPVACFYLIVHGTVQVQRRDWRVHKTIGDFFCNSTSVSERDLDPRNFTWAYQGFDEYLAKHRDSTPDVMPMELARETRTTATAQGRPSMGRRTSSTPEPLPMAPAKKVRSRAQCTRMHVCSTLSSCASSSATHLLSCLRCLLSHTSDPQHPPLPRSLPSLAPQKGVLSSVFSDSTSAKSASKSFRSQTQRGEGLGGVQAAGGTGGGGPSDDERTRFTALTDGQLLMLSPKAFVKFLSLSKHFYDAMTRTLHIREEVVDQLPAIAESDVPSHLLAKLVHMMKFTTHEPGTEIYNESSAADDLHFLLHGSAVVTPPSPAALRMQSDLASGLTIAQITAANAAAAAAGGVAASSVARRSFSAFFSPENTEEKPEAAFAGSEVMPGAHFGETAMILKWSVQGGSAVAKTKALVATVGKHELDTFFGHLPELQSELVSDTKRHVLSMLRAVKLPFLSDLNDEQLKTISREATLHLDCPARVPICTQGETPDALYVVLTGTVRATRQKDLEAEVAAGETSAPKAPSPAPAPDRVSFATDVTDASTAPPTDMVKLRQSRKFSISRASGSRPGETTWTVRPASSFCEVPLLYQGEGSTATYEPGLEGCTLLALPRTSFLALFAEDESLLAEVCIKLLREAVPLQSILNHRRARRLFAMHLDNRRLGASHTLEFHAAVRRYGKVGALGMPAALLVISQSIVGEFIMKRSPHAVAISDESRSTILAEHAKGRVPVDILLREAEHIFSALTSVDLKGFVSSAPYQEFLSRLGSYSAELVAADVNCSPQHLESFEQAASEALMSRDAPAGGRLSGGAIASGAVPPIPKPVPEPKLPPLPPAQPKDQSLSVRFGLDKLGDKLEEIVSGSNRPQPQQPAGLGGRILSA